MLWSHNSTAVFWFPDCLNLALLLLFVAFAGSICLRNVAVRAAAGVL